MIYKLFIFGYRKMAGSDYETETCMSDYQYFTEEETAKAYAQNYSKKPLEWHEPFQNTFTASISDEYDITIEADEMAFLDPLGVMNLPAQWHSQYKERD